MRIGSTWAALEDNNSAMVLNEEMMYTTRFIAAGVRSCYRFLGYIQDGRILWQCISGLLRLSPVPRSQSNRQWLIIHLD